MTDTSALIQRGMQAWADGDLDDLETVLDPQVSLRWYQAGDWDCSGRELVMRLLRQRQPRMVVLSRYASTTSTSTLSL